MGVMRIFALKCEVVTLLIVYRKELSEGTIKRPSEWRVLVRIMMGE